MKKILITYILIISLIILSACGKKDSSPIQNTYGAGSHVARINLKDYGAIDLRLFGNQAPEVVNLFIEAAKSGAFNNVEISTIIKDYYLSITANNTSFSTADKPNADNGLYPFNGALFVTCNGEDSFSFDTFYIISNTTDSLHNLYKLLEYKELTPTDYFNKAYGAELTEDDLAWYEQYGGAPWLQNHCIVFGQITSGFEILETLSDVDVDEASQPIQSVIIDSIEIK